MTNILLLISSFLLLSAPVNAESLKEVLFRETKSGQISFSYDNARKKMFNEIYLEKDAEGFYIEDVYCQDKYYPFAGQHPNGRLPDPVVFNTEHTWPQSKFSNRFSANTQKTDLHHLFPTFSRINSERGNLPFAEVNAERELSCDESHRGHPVRGGNGTYFEPPDEHKGNVARAMFYFSIRYQTPIDPVQEYYLRLWHKEDPVDATEKARHERIAELQGNRNPFIDRPEYVDQITDF